MAEGGPPDGQQVPFPHLVKWVEMVTRARAEQALSEIAVSGSQLLVLVLLNQRGEATSADLARMMHITPQALTTLIGPLRQSGYIDRRADAAHARRQLMRLTASGQTVLEAAHRTNPAIEDDLLSDFTVDERHTLKRLLARIARRFD